MERSSSIDFESDHTEIGERGVNLGWSEAEGLSLAGLRIRMIPLWTGPESVERLQVSFII